MAELKQGLYLDWASPQAARYAVEHFHYSRRMPVGKAVRVGVWEDGKFIGCVIFSMGNNLHIGDKFGLTQFQICELTRVALTKHSTPVTRIVSIALKMLHKQCPGLKAVISYADPEQGHKGGIYHGGNWEYLGLSTPSRIYVLDGRKIHSRVANPGAAHFGNPSKRPKGIERATIYTAPGKHKFVWFFDKTKRCAGSETETRLVNQPEKGGLAPTPALQISE